MYVREGTSIRMDCEHCSREFEVLLEPKIKEGGQRVEIKYCPFCGEPGMLTGDEED